LLIIEKNKFGGKDMRNYIIAFIIILLDQITKWLIVKELEIGEKIEVIKNIIDITSYRNRGAAWGMLQNQMWLFYGITLIVIIGIVFYLQKYAKNQLLLGISLSLMLGGAIGNFIDRLFRHEVVDFVQVYIGSYDFPIFNLADSALCVGVIFLIIDVLVDGKKEK
jgi:signal peptidase II